MSEEANKQRKLRTWSALGDVRRRPSEYEVVGHRSSYSTRMGRLAPLEQNSSSPANLWLKSYRDGSGLQAKEWELFRDPDTLTYRSYVAHQHAEETRVEGLLDAYSGSGHDARLDPSWVRTLATVFTPTRYLVHGMQLVEAYITSMAPAGYIANAATFSMADLLRRVTLVSYRTRELQNAHPSAGFATGERQIWETLPAWQPARELIERALTAYDWAEALTALNLVIGPTLDDLLLRRFGAVAKEKGDELTWHLSISLTKDSERRARWSAALVKMAVEQEPASAAAVNTWVDKWSTRADGAAAALAPLIAAETPSATAAAKAAREQVLAAAGLQTISRH